MLIVKISVAMAQDYSKYYTIFPMTYFFKMCFVFKFLIGAVEI